MTGFYRLKPNLPVPLYALFPLSSDVEITTFDGAGQDMTFKGSAGDILVLVSDDDSGEWTPLHCVSAEDAEDTFDPIGDA